MTVLKECTAQYHRYTYWRIVCALTAPALMGLWMAFNIDRQEMALRHRVASLGLDAEQWEQHLRSARHRALWNAFLTFLAIVLVLVFLSILIASAGQSHYASGTGGTHHERHRASDRRPALPQIPLHYYEL